MKSILITANILKKIAAIYWKTAEITVCMDKFCKEKNKIILITFVMIKIFFEFITIILILELTICYSID